MTGLFLSRQEMLQRKSIFSAILIVLSCLIFTSVKASVVVDQTTEKLDVGGQTEYLLDRQQSWTIDDVVQPVVSKQFEPSEKRVPVFGYTNQAIWLRLNVRDIRESSEFTTWYLELAYPNMDEVAFYARDRSGQYQEVLTGDSKPFSQRPVDHTNFVLPFETRPGFQQTLYLRVHTKGANQVPLTIWKPDSFSHASRLESIVWGCYYGIMLAMICYNLFLFVALNDKDSAYLYYSLYIASFALLQAMLMGHAFEFFWPENTWWASRGTFTMMALSQFMMVMFTRNFLKVSGYSPRMDAILKLVLGACILIGSITLVVYSPEVSNLTVLLMSLGIIVIFLTALVSLKNGLHAARYFIAAFAAIFAGVLVNVAKAMDYLPSNMITDHALQIGSLIEVIMLSLALAYRINLEKREKMSVLAQKNSMQKELLDAEQKILHDAMHDQLTGLPNAAKLQLVGPKLIQQHMDQSTPLALLTIYLSQFHEINNTLGRDYGDELLKVVCARLHEQLSKFPSIVDFSGGGKQKKYLCAVEGVTFAAALTTDNADEIRYFSDLIIMGLNKPLRFKGMSLSLNPHIGVALCPQHSSNIDGLLRYAFVAAETATRHQLPYVIYSSKLNPYSQRRLTLMGDLANAIESDALDLHFQPQLDIKSNSLIGAESLIRWNHAQMGFISPVEFVPLAERSGIIRELSQWVLNKALERLNQFDQEGVNLETISVNFSALDLQYPEIAEEIVLLLKKHHIKPERLMIEITETAMMDEPDVALKTLHNLHELGIKLSIDDFGTGYSSLSYLKQLPIDELKIDRSFISEMAQNRDDAIIVQTTLHMSHNFGLKVVAEGIEDKETVSVLRTMGCDIAQGYYFAKPMPSRDFIHWAKNFSKGGTSITVLNRQQL